jgi:quinol monooxygenase YgiN
MFLTIVRLFPFAEEKAALQEFLAGVLGPMRVQPGCLGCTLATESDPDALLFMERWQTKDDLLRRLQSDAYAKILATMELSTGKPEVSIFEVISQDGLEFIERVRMPDQDGTAANP